MIYWQNYTDICDRQSYLTEHTVLMDLSTLTQTKEARSKNQNCANKQFQCNHWENTIVYTKILNITTIFIAIITLKRKSSNSCRTCNKILYIYKYYKYLLMTENCAI